MELLLLSYSGTLVGGCVALLMGGEFTIRGIVKSHVGVVGGFQLTKIVGVSQIRVLLTHPKIP